MDCSRSCHSISIGFKSRLWLGHSKSLILFFLSHSEVNLLVSLGSLSCCITQVRLSLRSQNWWPDILLQDFLIECRIHGSVKYGKSSRSWSCKAAPDHYTTTTMFDCWYDVLFHEILYWFYARCNGTHTFQKVQLLSHQSTEYLPKSLGDNQYIFWQMWDKPLCSFWSAMAFALEHSHGCRFFPSLFLIAESWTLTLIEASEACSSLDVVLGSLMTSWMCRHCALGVILVGRPLLGRFTTVPSFSPFVDNGSDRGSLESQSLRKWLYNPFQTDTCQLFCFSSVLEFL